MPEHQNEPDEPRRMLVPQFSLRWLLGAITAAAGLSSIVAIGARGQAWAIAVSVAVFSVAFSGLVYAAAFGLVWIFSNITSGRRETAAEAGPGRSPFASPRTAADSSGSDNDVAVRAVALDKPDA